MSFTIATWNINSVRLRLPLVKRFVEANRPDVLCLQETKVRDSEFPFDRLRELGYDHIEISGQKGYHGVATLSRHPLTRAVRGPFCREGHSRHLAVTLADGVGPAAGLTIHNFYLPPGGDEPDPEVKPLGVKGLGEIGIVAVAAAVANAIYHATGIRVRSLPITVDKLMAA